MHIFIFQDEKEVEPALQFLLHQRSIHYRSVAWNASAIDGLKSSGLKYFLPSEYLDKKFGIDEFYLRILAYRDWSLVLDKIIAKHCNEVKGLNINSFLHQMFANRSLFNIYFNDIEKLFQLWTSFSNSTFHIYHYSKKEFSPLSRIVDLLLEQKSWAINIEVHEPSWKIGGTMIQQSLYPDWISEMDLFNRTKFQRFKNIIKNRFIKSGDFDVSYLKNLILKFISTIMRDTSNIRKILVLNTSYEVSSFLAELREKIPIEIIYWNEMRASQESTIKFNSTNIMEEIMGDSLLSTFTTYLGVDFSSLIYPMIKEKIDVDLPRYVNNIHYFIDQNKQVKFDLIIAGYEVSLGEAIFSQCFRLGIPAMYFYHGGVGVCLEKLILDQDVRYGDSELCIAVVYTQNMKKYHQSRIKMFNSQINVKTFPSYYYKHLYKRKNKKCNYRLSICYVAGPFGPLINSEGKRGINHESALYYLLWKLIERVADRKNIDFLYKFGREMEKYQLQLFDKIQNGYWHNIKSISSNRPLIEVMHQFDLFLLDSPSSAFSELQATQKPILALFDSKNFELTKEAHEMVKKRVMITSTETEFLRHFDAVIEMGHKAPVFTECDVEDDRFYRAYCWDRSDTRQHILEFFDALPRRQMVSATSTESLNRENIHS